MTDQAKRHSLADWLALHELDPLLCRRILEAAGAHLGNQPDGQEKAVLQMHAPDPDVAWLGAVDAMCAFFPARRAIIESAFENMRKVHVDGKRRALTLDGGKNGHPTIVYTYSGKASDFMVIAHEFAHAVQLVASKGKFVAPVIREACAFVGEIAFLSRSRDIDAVEYPGLRQAWLNDNRKYLGSDAKKLEGDLGAPKSAYRYDWNYPIARYLSIEIAGQFSRDRIWTLFEGQGSVRKILSELNGWHDD